MAVKNAKLSACITQVMLLVWFSLDMVGVRLGGQWLVTRSFREDGVFFVLALLSFLCFTFCNRIGRKISLVWLGLWAVAQGLAHEFYTVFGWGLMGDVQGKMRYFSDTVKLIESDGRYIPDLYHIVLHVLIVLAFIYTLRYKPPDETEACRDQTT